MDWLTELLRWLIVVFLGLTSGCSPAAPIYVTPTPALPATTQAAEVVVLPSATPVAPATTAPVMLTPQVTWQGPVVSGNPLPPTLAAPIPTTSPISGAPTQPPAPATAVIADATLSPTFTATTGAPAPVMPNLDPGRIGVQLDINLSQEDWNTAMGEIERLGVRWVKVQMPWRDMQPNGPDDFGNEFFARVEQHLEDAANRGLNVMISIAKAPAWARSVQDEDGPPDNPQTLANFITIVFREINPDLARPMLGEYIDAVEVWNEPNLLREWRGALPFSGAGYMQLFAAAYQAIRAYSPTMPIITAGLAPSSNSAGSIDDRDYLRQMYQAGLASYSDVLIGIHPYSWANAPDERCCNTIEGKGWDDDPHFFFANTLDEYRQIKAEYGDGDSQMWVTEFGYASWDGLPASPPVGDEWMRDTDRMEQGIYTMRTLEILQSSPDVGNTMLWNLNFATLAGLLQNGDERAAYSMIVPGTLGVVDPASTDRTERPIYWMLYDAVRPDVQLPSF